MKKLGLDISSNVVGYAISEDNKILDCGFIDISKVKSYKDKSNVIIEGLTGKTFDTISVEETLAGFSFGGTSMQTILTLAKNKAVICYILEEYYKIPINFYNVVTMRKKVFGIGRIKGVKPKIFVKQQLETLFPDVKNFYKLNKKGNEDKKNEDLRDAVVVSLY